MILGLRMLEMYLQETSALNTVSEGLTCDIHMLTNTKMLLSTLASP